MDIKKRFVSSAFVVALVLTTSLSAFGQSRPYHDGSVWEIATIRMKPGMDSAYLKYLATDWKRNQEALKKEGLIVSYKVIVTEAHGATDWNLLLMTEFKNLAAYEASQDRSEAILQTVVGDDQKQMQGYRDRLEIREVLGSRLSREILLEPKKQ